MDFLAIGGEELLETAFFRFSFFRRRVPPIDSSLKVMSVSFNFDCGIDSKVH